MQSAATAEPDGDALARSIASEQAGDRAREDGQLVWALAHFRQAAEIRTDDPRLATKIAETVAARAAAGQRPVRSTPSSPRRPSPSSIVTLIAAGILTLGNVLASGKSNRHDPIEPMPVAAAPASGAYAADVRRSIDMIGSPPVATAESPICLVDATDATRTELDSKENVAAKIQANATRPRRHEARRGHARRARSRHHERHTVRRDRTRSHERLKTNQGRPAAMEKPADLSRC
jgi:hypothetical protein